MGPLAAYRAMWADLVTAARTSNFQSPRLSQHATGQALTLFVQGLARDQLHGIVTRGEPLLHPVVDLALARPGSGPGHRHRLLRRHPLARIQDLRRSGQERRRWTAGHDGQARQDRGHLEGDPDHRGEDRHLLSWVVSTSPDRISLPRWFRPTKHIGRSMDRLPSSLAVESREAWSAMDR